MRHPVDAAPSPLPIPGSHMVGMSIVRVAGRDSLLRGKISLLVLGNDHQIGKRVVFLRHAHILNFFEELCKREVCPP